VSLPLTSAVAMRDLDNATVLQPEGNGLPDGFSELLDGLRILVVDDELDSRELITAILTRCGSEVKCTQSAAEALRALRDWKPDLLLSDIGMPQEDGYNLIRKVRKMRSKWAREIPAVALTAYATVEDRARALDAGFQIHVAKPIEPEALVRSIAGATGRKI
jgi:CheY-like chemotaxis protein